MNVWVNKIIKLLITWYILIYRFSDCYVYKNCTVLRNPKDPILLVINLRWPIWRRRAVTTRDAPGYARHLKMVVISFEHLQKICYFLRFMGIAQKLSSPCPMWFWDLIANKSVNFGARTIFIWIYLTGQICCFYSEPLTLIIFAQIDKNRSSVYHPGPVIHK